MKTAAYHAGVSDALESFGVRVASDLMRSRMPTGPEHLGAEWLAKTLSAESDEFKSRSSERSPRKLERPVHWGPKSHMGQGNDY